MAKELRRMGLEVVPADNKEDEMSGRDVQQVTEVTQTIAELGKRARTIADGLKQNVADSHAALDIAESVSKTLGTAAAELRAALGIQTNSPPAGGEQEEGKT